VTVPCMMYYTIPHRVPANCSQPLPYYVLGLRCALAGKRLGTCQLGPQGTGRFARGVSHPCMPCGSGHVVRHASVASARSEHSHLVFQKRWLFNTGGNHACHACFHDNLPSLMFAPASSLVEPKGAHASACIHARYHLLNECVRIMTACCPSGFAFVMAADFSSRMWTHAAFLPAVLVPFASLTSDVVGGWYWLLGSQGARPIVVHCGRVPLRPCVR
jgi:hypothetical protein